MAEQAANQQLQSHAISHRRNVAMDYYWLDKHNCPRFTDMAGYYEWKNSLPDADQTGIGFCVARTEREDVCISTVYLGLDHAFGDGPPVLWETVVFGGEGDTYCERYTSQQAAEEGHKAACEKYLPDPTTKGSP